MCCYVVVYCGEDALEVLWSFLVGELQPWSDYPTGTAVIASALFLVYVAFLLPAVATNWR